jgi:hypothetical protein
MKKLIVFLIFFLVNLCGFARNDILPTPDEVLGDTMIISNTSVCNGVTKTLSIPSFLGFQTSCSYSCNGISYYTTDPHIVLTFNVLHDTTFVCYIDSINGVLLNTTMAISIAVICPPTISIGSIYHVTCPDGYLYPYADGSFHVSLDDSVQNYAWINIENQSLPFFVQVYDSITLTDLRSGTYRIVAYGTNGCTYTDSVVIEQPEMWYFNEDSLIIDTVCNGETGCIFIDVYGGTPPYSFTWFYYVDTGQVFMEDTTRFVCNLYSGVIYCIDMFDSKGCRAFGGEMSYIITHLYEYVEDSTHLITTNPIACYGSPFLVQAQSIGYGDYVWYVGDSIDSLNYWIWVAADSVVIADFYTPPMTEPTFVSVDFYDQHGCITHDSVWVNIYNPEISLTIETAEITTDSTFTVHVFPPGGSLYIDDIFIAENVLETYTLSTTGFLVGEHILRYYGIFGGELDLQCEDEISIPFQIQSRPFVTAWDQEISIYPNPATTVLNLSSTEMMDMILSITDITGRVIQTEKVLDSYHVIDVSGLTAGVYLLRMEASEGAAKTMKFVKR